MRQGSPWWEFELPPSDALSEIEHSFTILNPYGALKFDFRVLAEAVARVSDHRMDEPLDIDVLRYDFAGISRCKRVFDEKGKTS